MIILKSERELQQMYAAGQIVAQTHQKIAQVVQPGVTTQELDALAEAYILECGARPVFKGYQGFPGSICASVNEEVVHGLPSLRKLVSGDIISIDIGASLQGYVGDAAVTLAVGEIDQASEELLAVTEKALYEGIKQAVIGKRLSDISHAIQSFVEKKGMTVVRDFVGHGVGQKMHEAPQIPNFGPPGRGPRLRKGMTLAIEPMVNLGTYEVETLLDNWTVVTKDRKRSAHFEHSIAITEKGPWILTKND